MALNFDPTKKIKGVSSTVKIFEEPTSKTATPTPQATKEEPKVLAEPIEVKPESIPEVQTASIGFKAEPEEEKASNRFQTVSNDLNRLQTASDTVSNGFKRTQTVSTQTVSKGSKRSQTVSQTVSKMPSVAELNLLSHFSEVHKNNGSILVQRNQVAESLGLTLAGVKTALVRLKKKGFINLENCSRGRYTGFTSYSLTESAYKVLASTEALDLLGFKRFQTVSQTVSKDPYSSSFNLNNNTNTIGLVIPEELKELGISEKSFSASLGQGLTVEEVQQSIEAFTHDWKNNLIKSNSPLKILFGVLKKGQPYLSLQFAEKTSKELNATLERLNKLQEEEKALREAEFKLRFMEWKKANPEKVEEVLTKNSFVKNNPKMSDIFLMEEYRKLETEAQ